MHIVIIITLLGVFDIIIIIIIIIILLGAFDVQVTVYRDTFL
jgi:hypothetical protein